MTDPFQSLLAGAPQKKVDAERLKLMGKQAASRFVSEGTPLADSVIKLASEMSGLNAHHIRRLCEFANQAAFQLEFEKSAGEINRAPKFDYADPDAVIRDMNAPPGPAPGAHGDYKSIPREEVSGDLAEMFGVKTASMEKTALSTKGMMLVGAGAAGVPAAAGVMYAEPRGGSDGRFGPAEADPPGRQGGPAVPRPQQGGQLPRGQPAPRGVRDPDPRGWSLRRVLLQVQHPGSQPGHGGSHGVRQGQAGLP